MMAMIIWTMMLTLCTKMRVMKVSLPQCCKVLLAGLADSSEQDIDGFTAADLAEYNGHYDCARYLRNVQANVRPPHGQSSVLCLTCHPSSGRPLIYPSSRVVFSV